MQLNCVSLIWHVGVSDASASIQAVVEPLPVSLLFLIMEWRKRGSLWSVYGGSPQKWIRLYGPGVLLLLQTICPKVSNPRAACFDLTALTLAQFQLFLMVCLVLYVKGLNGCLNPRYITNNLKERNMVQNRNLTCACVSSVGWGLCAFNVLPCSSSVTSHLQLFISSVHDQQFKL